MGFPKSSSSHDDIIGRIREAMAGDADWRHGRIWSLVYFAGDDVADLLKDAYTTSFYTNGLGLGAFKSLKKFESEVIGMTAELLGLPDAVGNITSGGTESIIMAVKTARDWARAEKGITEPEMVLPASAHPAFDKAGQYLGVTCLNVPLAEDYRADVSAAGRLVTSNTVLIAGSAPCYPFGKIDPIPELAALAQEHGVPCHVDACLGGFLLPFIERLGRTVPPWDFSVPGVASISADMHKYGYSARGASAIIYRDKSYRRHQFFTKSDWPGGLYGSPTMAGSRPGGAIAAAWAVLKYLGEQGYTRLAGQVMAATRALIDGITGIPGLRVLGEPDMSVFAFTSDRADIYAVGDCLAELGWYPDRQQSPPSLHLMVSPVHARFVDEFLDALRQAVEKAGSPGQAAGLGPATYGMASSQAEKP